MTDGRDPQTGQFVLGYKGGPGRQKGSRNKLGEEFLDAMQKDFQNHGVDAIVAVRNDRPHEYLKVIASLLPKDVTLTHEAGEAFAKLWTLISERTAGEMATRLVGEPGQPAPVRNGSATSH